MAIGDTNHLLFYGDDITELRRGTLRLFFQNVHGITSTNDDEDTAHIMSIMHDLHVDVMGLAETQTPWIQRDLRSKYHNRGRRQFKMIKSAYGSPSLKVDPISPDDTFQAGGTVTSAFGEWATKVLGKPITDKSGMGRFSGLTFLGKGTRKLSVITAYRVCDSTTNSAPIGSAYAREWNQIRNTGTNRPRPRTQLLTDLTAVIKELTTNNHEVIVMMDSNETLESKRDFGLSSFVQTNGLQDAHGNDPAPSTYIQRDNRRIDHVFCTSGAYDAIKGSGTLAYGRGIQADHRGLFLDLDIEAVLGKMDPNRILPAALRSLKTGDPDSVDDYLRDVNKYYHDHNMVEQIYRLWNTHDKLSKEHITNLIEGIDQDQGRAMLEAEKHLKRPKQAYQWSNKLRLAGLLRRYWKTRVNDYFGQRNSTKTYNNLRHQLISADSGYTELPEESQSLTGEALKQRYNAAVKHYKTTRSKAANYQHQLLEDILAKYENDDDPKTKEASAEKARIVRRTMLGEKCRDTFKTIGNAVKPTATSGVQRILLARKKGDDQPAPNQTEFLRVTKATDIVWDHVIDRTEIEKRLLEFNRRHFRQAAESPCGHGIIYNALQFSSLTSEGYELLRGIVPESWHGNEDLLKEFLASFALPDVLKDTQPINTHITNDDFVYGIKGWKETTSTSPSGRHLGHYTKR